MDECYEQMYTSLVYNTKQCFLGDTDLCSMVITMIAFSRYDCDQPTTEERSSTSTTAPPPQHPQSWPPCNDKRIDHTYRMIPCSINHCLEQARGRRHEIDTTNYHCALNKMHIPVVQCICTFADTMHACPARATIRVRHNTTTARLSTAFNAWSIPSIRHLWTMLNGKYHFAAMASGPASDSVRLRYQLSV